MSTSLNLTESPESGSDKVNIRLQALARIAVK
jgi:hypothetical protein